MTTKTRKTIEEELEKIALKKAARRQKKQPKMKVSGRQVFNLQHIIIRKKAGK